MESNKQLDCDSISREPSILSVISQVDEGYCGSGSWVIPISKLRDRTSLMSRHFYIGGVNYCKFRIEMRYQEKTTSGPIDFEAVALKFLEELPMGAALEGSISFENKDENKFFDQHEFFSKGNIKELTFCHDNNSLLATTDLKKFTVNNNLKINWSLKMQIGCFEWKSDHRSFSLPKRHDFIEEDETFNFSKKNLYQNRSFTDVTFRVHGGTVDAHQGILFRNVSGFRLMFNTHPTIQNQFNIYDIDQHPFDQMLQFVYCDDIPSFGFTLACLLYVGAYLYQVHSLHNLCCSYLATNLTRKNVFIALSVADRCEDLNLKGHCIEFIQNCDKKVLAEESVLITK